MCRISELFCAAGTVGPAADMKCCKPTSEPTAGGCRRGGPDRGRFELVTGHDACVPSRATVRHMPLLITGHSSSPQQLVPSSATVRHGLHHSSSSQQGRVVILPGACMIGACLRRLPSPPPLPIFRQEAPRISAENAYFYGDLYGGIARELGGRYKP